MLTGKPLTVSRSRNRKRFPISCAYGNRVLLLFLLLALIPHPWIQAQVEEGPPNPAVDIKATSGRGMQGESTPLNGAPVTTGMLESKIEEIASASDLDETIKNKLNELYRRALSSLQAVKSFQTNADAYAI